MSFIGPRVVGSGEIRLREHAVRKRYNVRPGLICLWWIRRRANIAYGNRPFIPHVGQYLTHQGVTDFYFVLSHLPEKLETLLGDGQRWDSTFRYHLIRDPDHPYQNLKHILLPDTPILLAHGDRLPECHILSDQNDFVLFCHTPKPNGTKNMDRLGPVNTL